ncbi:hypothetical protein [Owenweeksia hongkongensis]|uniref:hypothetical protein n=1 Tax=Owenweeksia hongkongensis TaxID=253245 RepID=UPI003A930774
MKTLYKLNLMVLFVLICATAFAQETPDQQRDKVEKNTAPYSTDYFTRSGNSYYVMTLSVEKGKMVVDQNSKLEEVKGKFPYQRGNLNVQVMDTKGERLANFFMPDPLVVRSCEGEGSETTPIQKGSIQIPLPKASNIGKIELVRGKQTVDRVDVSAVVEEFIKRQRGDGGKDEEE